MWNSEVNFKSCLTKFLRGLVARVLAKNDGGEGIQRDVYRHSSGTRKLRSGPKKVTPTTFMNLQLHRKSLVAICASISRNSGKYFTSVVEQDSKKEIIDVIRRLVIDALFAYQAKNKKLPDKIVAYRASVADTLTNVVVWSLNDAFLTLKVEHEVPQFLAAFKAMKKEDYNPEFILILVKKRGITRLFASSMITSWKSSPFFRRWRSTGTRSFSRDCMRRKGCQVPTQGPIRILVSLTESYSRKRGPHSLSRHPPHQHPWRKGEGCICKCGCSIGRWGFLGRWGLDARRHRVDIVWLDPHVLQLLGWVFSFWLD